MDGPGTTSSRRDMLPQSGRGRDLAISLANNTLFADAYAPTGRLSRMTSFFSRAGASICVPLLAALGIVSGTTTGITAQSPGPWKPLFNGKDLSGWTVLAGGGRGRAGGAASGA